MRFIFIGGCGRSGTTLVQKIITSHSMICGGPEFDHTAAIVGLYKTMSSDFFLKRQSYFYDSQNIDDYFRRFYASFFEKIYRSKSEAVFVSEKTPVNIQSAELLLELFPDSVFINVVRDGRDVFLSHREVADRYESTNAGFDRSAYSPIRVSDVWNKAIDKYFRLARSPHAERVFNIRYEELMNDATTTMVKCCDFLGVSFEEQMVDPVIYNEGAASRIKADGIWHTEGMMKQNFQSAQNSKWREKLSSREIGIVNYLMKENLRKLGYETEPQNQLKEIVIKIYIRLKLMTKSY